MNLQSHFTRNAWASLGMLLAISIGSGRAQVDRSHAPEAGPAPQLNIGTSTQFELSNGLKVIVVENHKTPSVSWNLTLDFPPFLEGDKAGLQEMVGATLAGGTSTRSKAEIAEDVEFLGASFNASSDGFYARSLSKHSEALMDIVADAVLHPSFPEDEVEKARKQKLSSLANTATSPGSIASNLVAAINFGPDHPYGEITTEESVSSITRDDLLAYHKTYFRPNVGYLIVVGDITPDDVKRVGERVFAGWRRGDIPFYRVPTPKLPTGNQVRFAELDGAVQSTINITQPVPLPPSHPDAMAVAVMNSILGGGAFSGRLMQNLREDKAYTYGARSSLNSDPVCGQFLAYADVRTEVTDSAVVEFLHEINRIRTTLVDSVDLASTKSFMAGSFARSLESPGTVARFALNIARYGLQDDHYTTYLQRLEAVTVDDVQRVAKSFLKSNNLNICIVGNPSILDKLRPFDESEGVDLFDAFGHAVIPRTPAPEGVTAQSVINAYYEAIGGAKAWKKVAGMETFGSIEFGMGMSLEHKESKQFGKKNRAIRTELAMAGQGVMTRIVTESGGEELQMGQVSRMEPSEVDMSLQAMSPSRFMDMLGKDWQAVVLGSEPFKGEPTVVVEFSQDHVVETHWFGISDGLLKQSKRPSLDGGTQVEQFNHYLPFGDLGLKLPSEKVTSVSGQTMTIRLAKATFNPIFEADTFKLTP
ncbi:MAG: pitrilysin family protein [Bacteroidetes bacterium]|nr:pitrilysin family protein [Bacteroidota bacterium]MDA0903631.1 pitrilysin family protein [Bacteroidota bacterium]MDA1242615.1 pitrilysin family protein [Bacteroidota bacterium]